jgi:hypothetical protein
MDAPCNHSGESISVVSRELMDAQNYGWRNARAAAVIRHVMIDPGTPHDFLVYPPSDGTAKIDLVCAMIPGNTLLLDAIWTPAVLNYVLFRAYSKDAEFAGNAQIAMVYYQAFQAQITGRAQAEIAENPNLANEARNPAVPVTLSR